jgi:hypothetical protein
VELKVNSPGMNDVDPALLNGFEHIRVILDAPQSKGGVFLISDGDVFIFSVENIALDGPLAKIIREGDSQSFLKELWERGG